MDIAAGEDIKNGNRITESSDPQGKRRIAYYYDSIWILLPLSIRRRSVTNIHSSRWDRKLQLWKDSSHEGICYWSSEWCLPSSLASPRSHGQPADCELQSPGQDGSLRMPSVQFEVDFISNLIWSIIWTWCDSTPTTTSTSFVSSLLRTVIRMLTSLLDVFFSFLQSFF